MCHNSLTQCSCVYILETLVPANPLTISHTLCSFHMAESQLDKDLLFGMTTGGDQVRILSYAAEGVPITRADVQAYQSQLVAVRQQASSQVVKPMIGLLSSVDNPLMMSNEALNGPPIKRAFGLSDEQTVSTSHTVAGVDKAEIQRIMQQLQFHIEPVHRAWATQQQQAAESSNFYNYGLNDRVLREYIEAQIALRIEKSRRQSVKIVGSTDVAGNRQHAAMRPHQEAWGHVPVQQAPPPVHRPQPAPVFQQPAYHDPWKV